MIVAVYFMRHSVRESPWRRYPANRETHPVKRGWGLRFGLGSQRATDEIQVDENRCWIRSGAMQLVIHDRWVGDASLR